jgi:hypothetical protein
MNPNVNKTQASSAGTPLLAISQKVSISTNNLEIKNEHMIKYFQISSEKI